MIGLQEGFESELNTYFLTEGDYTWNLELGTFHLKPSNRKAFDLDSNRSHTAVSPRFFGLNLSTLDILQASSHSQLTACEFQLPTVPKRIKRPLVPTITNGRLGIRIKAALCHSGYFQPKIPWCMVSSVHHPKS